MVIYLTEAVSTSVRCHNTACNAWPLCDARPTVTFPPYAGTILILLGDKVNNLSRVALDSAAAGV